MSELPEGWAEAAFASLGVWSSGATPSKSNPRYWDGDIPWVSPKDLKTDFITDSIDHVSHSGVAVANLKVLPPGTLLFVVRGLILARVFPVALTRVPVTVNQDIRTLTPHQGIDPEYLFRALQHQAHDILYAVKEATHGTLRLDSDELQKWPIRISPFAEQRRIVEKLDLLLAKSAGARERLYRVRRTINTARRSLVRAAITGTLTHEWAQTRIPADEQEWSVERLGDRFDVATGATPLRKNRAYFDGGTVPWIKSGAVNSSMISEADEYITSHALRETNAKVFPKGTLVVAMYGEGATRGKVAELFIDAATNQALAAILFDSSNEALRPFLKLVLLDRYFASRAESLGGVQPNLSLEMIRGMNLRLPSSPERREIVRRTETFTRLMLVIESRVDAALARTTRLNECVLAKAFAGALVPTEADLARREKRNYEPASVLLERIRQEAERTPPRKRRTP